MATKYHSINKQSGSSTSERAFLKTGLYEARFKRVFDLSVVVLVLPFILPLMICLAIMVRHDGGPVFYSQQRVGRGGRIYRIWKLRTMVVDADRMLKSYLDENPLAAVEWASTQKLKNDPRITPIGVLLRKCSLDELPQLLNVLTGEMSLVGPRPMLPEQQDMYPGLAYYTQRPGITGSWQVSQRNESSFAERARFDTEYIANVSFINDIKLLYATVGVVVRGTGY